MRYDLDKARDEVYESLDGQQESLDGLLSSFADSRTAAVFRQALADGHSADKIYFNDAPAPERTLEDGEKPEPGGQRDKATWMEEIAGVKAAIRSGQEGQPQEIKKGQDCPDIGQR